MTYNNLESKNLCNLVYACYKIKLIDARVIKLVRDYFLNCLEKLNDLDLTLITVSIVKYQALLEK